MGGDRAEVACSECTAAAVPAVSAFGISRYLPAAAADVAGGGPTGTDAVPLEAKAKKSENEALLVPWIAAAGWGDVEVLALMVNYKSLGVEH